jgi:hypothetical protein
MVALDDGVSMPSDHLEHLNTGGPVREPSSISLSSILVILR